MAKHNPANARIKREYFSYLKEANRRDEASIDMIAKALARFEEANGHKDFRNFRRQQAIAFKRKLDEQHNVRTGKPLSRATVNSTLAALRAFFHWLAGQPGYKSRLQYADADYFNLSEKDVRVAKAVRHKSFPTLEQVHHVISLMPCVTDIEKRNRALIAFTILTGARIKALSTFKLKHFNLEEGRVDQDARDVATKASKSFSTWLLPVGGDALQIVQDWCTYLRTELLRGDDDALFPETQMGIGEHGGFQPVGLHRNGWKSTGPIRAIFRNAFAEANLPYFNPHSFRDTLVQFGERNSPNIEVFKAWSLNLGHTNIGTTLNSYGSMSPNRQAELIRNFNVLKARDAINPAALALMKAAIAAMDQ